MLPPIVLLTDFGHQDPYVGQMKGVILRHAPGVPIVDLCHEISACNVAQAAFMVHASYAFFPERSILVTGGEIFPYSILPQICKRNAQNILL